MFSKVLNAFLFYKKNFEISTVTKNKNNNYTYINSFVYLKKKKENIKQINVKKSPREYTILYILFYRIQHQNWNIFMCVCSIEKKKKMPR